MLNFVFIFCINCIINLFYFFIFFNNRNFEVAMEEFDLDNPEEFEKLVEEENNLQEAAEHSSNLILPISAIKILNHDRSGSNVHKGVKKSLRSVSSADNVSLF